MTRTATVRQIDMEMFMSNFTSSASNTYNRTVGIVEVLHFASLYRPQEETQALHAGGQKIIRCELSIDDAKTWRLAEIKRIQDRPNKGGKYWAWVFWEIPVSTGLSSAKYIPF